MIADTFFLSLPTSVPSFQTVVSLRLSGLSCTCFHDLLFDDEQGISCIPSVSFL